MGGQWMDAFRTAVLYSERCVWMPNFELCRRDQRLEADRLKRAVGSVRPGGRS